MGLENSKGITKKRKISLWMLIALGLLGIVIIVLITVIITLNIKDGTKCECNCDDEGSYTIVTEDEDELSSEEQKLSADEYAANVETAISQATTDEERAELYNAGAVDLWYYEPSSNNTYLERIRDYLQKAEELNPTMESAWWIYYIEDQLGNTERAAEYLDKAVERGFDKDGGAG